MEASQPPFRFDQPCLDALLSLDHYTPSMFEYVKDTSTAIDDSIGKIDRKEKQIAFFTNPEKMELIRMVANEGEKMPQKSTYFYPKIFTGLTIQKL